MTSRLGAILAADLPGLLADFGESVVYTPKNGVDRSLSAITEYGREEDITIMDVLATENEHLWVVALSDQSNTTYGGVTNPTIGDMLQGDGEASTSRWSFAGQAEELPGGWLMLFVRRRVTRYGPKQ
jgi:hypothetical protein